jgi:hypothetical protein
VSKDRRHAAIAVYNIDPQGRTDRPILLDLRPTLKEKFTLDEELFDPSLTTSLTVVPQLGDVMFWRGFGEQKVPVDKTGSFVVEGIIPGVTYRLRDESSFRPGREAIDKEMVLIPEK